MEDCALNLGAALPALRGCRNHAGDNWQPTAETAEANVPTPEYSQITENLCDDLRTRLWQLPWHGMDPAGWQLTKQNQYLRVGL